MKIATQGNIGRRSVGERLALRDPSGGQSPVAVAMLMRLAWTLSCLAACHAFRAVARLGRPLLGTSLSSPPPPTTPRGSRRRSRTSDRPLAAASNRLSNFAEDAGDVGLGFRRVRDLGGGGGGGGLLPRRERRVRTASALPMAADDAHEALSDDGSPLVRAWVSLRKLLARLWGVFLRPFQQMQSLLTKKDAEGIIKETKEGETIEIKEGEAISKDENVSVENEDATQERVVITEGENISAAGEEDIEAKDSVDAPAADTVGGEELSLNEQGIKIGVQQEVSEVASAAPETSTTTDVIGAPRQATSCPTIDLTGNWTLINDEAFTSQYDEYLRRLGQPMLVRTVALTVIGSTKEETVQSDGGQRLYIRGTNVRGSWERTLESSERVDDLDGGGSPGSGGQEEERHAVEGHVMRPMTTADGEDVEVASWWEDGGTVHHSWVVGGEKYGGGDFENKRYLTDGGNILVCESTFHPNDEGREEARVAWRFLREGAIYGDAAIQIPNIFDVLKGDEKANIKGSDELPQPGMIVGDIMDDVATTSGGDRYTLSAPDNENAPDVNMETIEEAIERESWVPPVGERWAICAPNIDLTGKWKLIITEKFKQEYDEFLRTLGQPLIVRGAAIVLIGNTREETKQSDGGRALWIKGVNAKGIWERTLTSSGSDYDTTLSPDPNDGSYAHARVPILTADSEPVDAESWWENEGTLHVSWTRGVKRYGGGAFESRRYLENDGNVYVCESTFHPNDEGREKSFLKWKFLREGAAFMLSEGSS